MASKKSKPSIFRYTPLALIVGMIVFLVILIYPSLDFTPKDNSPITITPSPLCKDGLSQYCSVDSCSGVSTCINGAWGGCTWSRVCTPGSRVNCLNQGCSYGYKICNECGTGFEQCINS